MALPVGMSPLLWLRRTWILCSTKNGILGFTIFSHKKKRNSSIYGYMQKRIISRQSFTSLTTYYLNVKYVLTKTSQLAKPAAWCQIVLEADP